MAECSADDEQAVSRSRPWPGSDCGERPMPSVWRVRRYLRDLNPTAPTSGFREDQDHVASQAFGDLITVVIPAASAPSRART